MVNSTAFKLKRIPVFFHRIPNRTDQPMPVIMILLNCYLLGSVFFYEGHHRVDIRQDLPAFFGILDINAVFTG